MIREKATLQELADRFHGYVATNKDGGTFLYTTRPRIISHLDEWQSPEAEYHYLDGLFDIDYTGDWKDSLHSPQHQYVEGERVIVWHRLDIFGAVRKVAKVEGSVMHTIMPNDGGTFPWDNHRPYDESLLGVPIAEWPEE